MSLRHIEIAPGVHRLATRYTNWYLLESGGRLTDIDAVFITHHHPDHEGGAERIREAGARVFAQRPSRARSRRSAVQSDLPGHGEPWLDGVKRAVAIARQTG